MAHGASVIEFPPPAASSPVTSPVPPPPASRLSRFSRWRLAARLARREVRRRPGRTVLVMLLIAAPVMGMTIGDISVRTNRQTWSERFRAQWGEADLGAWRYEDGLPRAVALQLPRGSRQVDFRSVRVPIRPADASLSRRLVELSDIPLDDPMATGIYELIDGTAPRTATEVALGADLAAAFDVAVGDVLSLASPKVDYRVVGIVQRTAGLEESPFIVGQFDWTRLRQYGGAGRTLVDLPDGVVPSELADRLSSNTNGTVAAFGTDGLSPQGRTRMGESPIGNRLAWGWVVGVLALTVLGIIVTAAFASSARRQLVTIGQLSSNGADPRIVRATLAMQGAWSGLAGCVLGVGLGAIGLAAGGSKILDNLANRDLGPLDISIIDLVVIVLTGVLAATLAAYVPARTAAKVPVMAALGGRRPLGRVPRRLVPIGLTLFASGLGLLIIAAIGTRNASNNGGSTGPFMVTAIIGGLGVLFGACCLGPVAVGLIGLLADRLSGSGRLAARSLARIRTRSSAVVTAIAAAGAVAIGISAALLSTDQRDAANRSLYEGYESLPATRSRLIRDSTTGPTGATAKRPSCTTHRSRPCRLPVPNSAAHSTPSSPGSPGTPSTPPCSTQLRTRSTKRRSMLRRCTTRRGGPNRRAV